MPKRLTTLVLLLLPAVAFADESDPRASLESAIADGIKLLAAKDFETFITRYAAPDELREMKAADEFEEVVQRFAGGKSELLLIVLKEIKDKEPKLTRKERLATFPIEYKKSPRETIEFEKIEGLWYLAN
jgi:hypothetical protein